MPIERAMPLALSTLESPRVMQLRKQLEAAHLRLEARHMALVQMEQQLNDTLHEYARTVDAKNRQIVQLKVDVNVAANTLNLIGALTLRGDTQQLQELLIQVTMNYTQALMSARQGSLH